MFFLYRNEVSEAKCPVIWDGGLSEQSFKIYLLMGLTKEKDNEWNKKKKWDVQSSKNLESLELSMTLLKLILEWG